MTTRSTALAVRAVRTRCIRWVGVLAYLALAGASGPARAAPHPDVPAVPTVTLPAAVAASPAAAPVSGTPSAPSTPDTRRSGAEFMSASTRAMQRDDSLNPGMLWVKDGEALWQAVTDSRPQASVNAGSAGSVGAKGNGSNAGIDGTNRSNATGPGASIQNSAGIMVGAAAGRQSCAACHGNASSSMRGVAARYPAFDEALQRPLTLSGRINQCRQKHQQAQPWRAESAELLAMESYVAFQSRAMPIAPPADPRLQPYQERGRERYLQRLGQLDLSCAQCHDQRAGLRLGSSLIPQAHPGGYPVYRLEWQGVGSLERRLRNCMSGVRAESFAFGSVELVELQLYLAARARGMPLEAPGVRP